MTESRRGRGKVESWDSSQGEGTSETSNEPLLVAMQPGSDMPSVEHVEVVVVTESADGQVTEEIVSASDIQTVVTTDTGQFVSVGAVEEVEEEGQKEQVVQEIPLVSDNKPIRRGQGVYAKNYGVPLKMEDPEDSPESEEEDEEEEADANKRTPKPREFAHRLQWRDKDMMEAMKAVSDKKITIRGAAKKYGVPYSTLKDRIHGRVRHGTKPGVKTALSPEEEEDLVQYIKDMESAGFQLRCIDVRDRAAEILRLNHGHNSPYKDCSPGHNWLAGFLKRHPGLSFKRAINRLGFPPSFQKMKNLIRNFYETTAYVYKKHRMNKKGDRVFVVGELHVNVFLEATILSSASANGSFLPPFVVFPGHRQKLNAAREAYPDAFFTNSYSGKISDEIFLWWFRDHFLKQLSGIPRPCVLFICRQLTDITFQLVQLAKEERIHLISIPTTTDQLLQPLDSAISEKLENLLEARASKWQEENPGVPFTQEIFAQLLKKVYRKTISPNEIMHKFAMTGVYPLNNSALSNESITRALRSRREDVMDASEDSEDLSGLSLLSALSSHEYASMEHVYTSGGSARTTIQQRNSPQSSSSLESTPTRSSTRKATSKLEEIMQSFSPPAKRRKQNEEALETITKMVERETKVQNMNEISVPSQSEVVVEEPSNEGEIIEEQVVEEQIVEEQIVKTEDNSIEVTLEVVENENGQQQVVTEYVSEFSTPKLEVKGENVRQNTLPETIMHDGRLIQIIPSGGEKVVTENLPLSDSYSIQEQVITEIPQDNIETVFTDQDSVIKPEIPQEGTQPTASEARSGSSKIGNSQLILSDGTTIVTTSKPGFISIPPASAGSEQPVYIQISEEMIQSLVKGNT